MSTNRAHIEEGKAMDACKAKFQRDRIGWHHDNGSKVKTSVCAHCDTLLYFLPKWGWFHWRADEQRCLPADVEAFKRARVS